MILAVIVLVIALVFIGIGIVIYMISDCIGEPIGILISIGMMILSIFLIAGSIHVGFILQ